MSDAAVILGTNDMALQHSGLRWSAESGETYYEEWKGPYTVALAFYQERRVPDGDWDEVDIDRTGPVGVVTLGQVQGGTGAGQPNTEDNATWEVIAQDISKRLATHPFFNQSPGMLADIVKAELNVSRAKVYAAADYTFTAQASRYYALRSQGVTDYLYHGLVIRKSWIVSRRSEIAATYENQNQVVALAKIDPPNKLIGNLNVLPRIVRDDATGLYTYTNPSDPTTAIWEDGNWEWLKKSPQVRSRNGGRRYDITLEWWGADAWSAVAYPGGTWDPAAT